MIDHTSGCWCHCLFGEGIVEGAYPVTENWVGEAPLTERVCPASTPGRRAG